MSYDVGCLKNMVISMNITIERKHWVDFILNNGPYSQLITVTFKYQHKDNEAIQLLNRLLRFTNRKIYGPRAIEKDRYISGFAFAERQQRRLTKQEIMLNKFRSNITDSNTISDKTAEQAKRSFNNDGVLHFHMLIKGDVRLNQFGANDLKHLIYEESKRLTKQAMKGHEYELFDLKGIDVRQVTDQAGLADYLTKEMKYVSANNISTLNKYGVEFISESLKRSA